MHSLRRQTGMRPQDVAVLLDLTTRDHQPWQQRTVAAAVHLSPSEVGAALARSVLASLYEPATRTVNRHALVELLTHGLRYVFPATLGPVVRGVTTAFSAPVLAAHIQSREALVWPYPHGTVRGAGAAVCRGRRGRFGPPSPLRSLALTDALRLGRVRERELAPRELTCRLLEARPVTT